MDNIGGKVFPEQSVTKQEKKLRKNPGERETWERKTEFLLSCIGFSVGLGNVWRFPYLAYENGGGAFLVAYFVILVLVGKPHSLAELAIGQFSGQGVLRMWRCFPMGKGIGFSMLCFTSIVAIYYNVIMCYTLYYLGQSFRSNIPWGDCYEWWGADENCYIRQSNQTHCWDIPEMLAVKYSDFANNTEKSYSEEITNITWKEEVIIVPLGAYEKAISSCSNKTETASEQFWERYVLQKTSAGITDLGYLKWDLTITLFICWLLVFLGLMKGIKSSGKVVYFTATFPYVILLTLVIYGCTLKGAAEGLKYFFIPEWSKLLEIKVWKAAAEQNIFSLSIGLGCYIMYSSYNKFDNKLYRDVMIMTSLDFATSIMAGVAIFSILGHLSTEMGIDIRHVTKGGQGLAFVAFPEAIAKLPVPQLWSVLFFFMLFLLAVDSEFSLMENVLTAVCDGNALLKRWKTVTTFVFCMLYFILGLPLVTQGGQYVLNLFDTYGGGYNGLFVVTFEIIALMWGYGADRFANDMHFMLGSKPGIYWRLCWKYVSPVVFLFVLLYSLATHEKLKYEDQTYPDWAEALGWLFIIVTILQIPIWAAVELYKNRKDIKKAFQPHPLWGPADPELNQRYQQQFSSHPNQLPKKEGIVNIGMDTLHDSFR